MFFRFENRLSVSGMLVAETAVRVGGGKDTEVAAPDLPVIRDGAGNPFIPGSSLKGVVRAHMESILRGVDDKLACDPTNLDGVCFPRSAFAELAKGQRDEEKIAALVEEHSCLICAVFGSQLMASHITFRDAPAEAWFGQFQVRNGVAINRDSGKAEGKALYDFEVVPAGTHFRFCVTLENGSPWMRGLVSVALRALEEAAITVGGGRSRGLGLMRLTEVSHEFIASPTELLEHLDRGKESTSHGRTVSDDTIKQWIREFRQHVEVASNVQAAR